MEYRLNTFSEQFDDMDSLTLKSLCNYYDSLLKYLEIMLKTDNLKVFYIAMNEAYTRISEPGEFSSFIADKLETKTHEIITPIKRYDDGEITKPYYEVWDTIFLKDALKEKYTFKDLEDLVNNKQLVVLENSKTKPVENEYVNTIGNKVYHMGVKVNKDALLPSHLTKRPIVKKSSYYYLENYAPAIDIIRDCFFSKDRIKTDIKYVSSLQTKYLRQLKDTYKLVRK